MSEDRFRQLAEALPQLVWTCRADGLCDYLSPQWVKYTGIPESEQLGLGWLNQLHPEDRERTIASWNAAVGTGLFFDIELRIRRSDGIYRWFSTRAIPLRDNEGRVTKWFGSNIDIEEHKCSEEELQRALNEMEKRVTERTKELQEANEKLQKHVTDRKRTEELLRESEENFRSSLDDSPLGVRIVTAEGETIYANRTMLDIYGFTSLEELRSTPVEKRYTAESYIEFKQRYARRQQGEDSPSEYEISIVRKNGEVRHLLVFRKQLLWNGKKQYQTLYQDITERKLAQDALRASEEQYRAVVKDQTEVICRFREDGTLTFVNEVFCRFYGKSARELLGQKWQPKVLTEDLPHIKAQLRLLSPSHPVAVIENRVYSGTGQVHWMQFINRGFFDSRGRLTETQAVGRDITERKKAEEALRASEELYRSLFDNMLNGFAYCRMIFDHGRPQDFIYLNVNSAFESLTGLKDVVGKKASEIFPGIRESDAELLEIYGRVAMTGKPEKLEKYFNALKMWLSISVYSLEKECFVAVFDVITERKRAEERTRMFSRELLAAHEEEKKRVSAVLHHNVGSMAVGMSAYFDAMEDDIRSRKAGKALKTAQTARKLFEQSVARLKETAIELWPPELDILGLHAAMRQHFSRITKRVGIRIHFTENLGRKRLPDDAATILFRIAQEALTNAITHGQAQKADVSLRASGKTARLTIRDNGKGFDLSEHREKNASSLGLHMMQDMATSAGGFFKIDSRHGKGTTVRVSLPLEKGR